MKALTKHKTLVIQSLLLTLKVESTNTRTRFKLMKDSFTVEIKGQSEHSIRFRLKKEDKYLTFKEVFELWINNTAFTSFYTKAILKLDYEAFYWEHPAINAAFLEKKYECVLQRSKPLEHLKINNKAFEEHISTQNIFVTDFLNLGKNARLIVPTKRTEEEIYNHLGKFIRYAESKQVIAVFKRVGQKMLEEIKKDELIWLNTAGLGVIWLHIRMDAKPKYYKTKTYKNPLFLTSMN